MINLEKHTKITLENLKSSIEKFKNKANTTNLENYLKTNNFEKRVLLLWWSQIKWSLSPFIHTYSSSFLKDKFLYTLVNLEEENLNINELLDFIENNDSILGSNVTMPYKIDIFEKLKKENKLDESAILVGAVNTIAKENWKLKWYNTDMEGIYLPLKEKLKNIAKNAVILWAWWAAKAAFVALIKLWVQNVFLLNRTSQRAIDFVNYFNDEKIKSMFGKDYNLKFVEYEVDKNEKNKISNIFPKDTILINTLPFGFKENLPKYPIIDEEFEKIKNYVKLYFDVVYDLNYGDTPMLSKFKQNNIKTIDGRSMLINQAVKWFELWTNGKKIDVEKLSNILAHN